MTWMTLKCRYACTDFSDIQLADGKDQPRNIRFRARWLLIGASYLVGEETVVTIQVKTRGGVMDGWTR